MGPQYHWVMRPNQFDRLKVDGRVLEGAAIPSYFDALEEVNKSDADWAQKLRDTAIQLVEGDGITALTSGTTGPPKQFLVPQHDLVASAELTRDAFGLRAGDRVLHCLPCDYIAGKLMLARAFSLGLEAHFIDPRGSVLDKLNSNDSFRFAAMVPVQLHRMLQEDRARAEQQFEMIMLGGGPVSDALVQALQGLSTKVFHGYGSTETVTHVALRRLNGPVSEDVYTALGDVQFARDPRGCLVVYTPHLSTTQHVTNDLVVLIDDTHFRWLGRHDNVILSGGKKIFPEQLEAKTAGIISYPHYFSGAPDPVLGQAVVLTLETARPENEVLPDVMEKMMFVLDRHEWPRRVITVRKIERTTSGKIKR